ncbi:MAG: YmaF family protein [Armatimonadetes bacterium]|nr:YmaF family protein [Armatimonadota bacterium]
MEINDLSGKAEHAKFPVPNQPEKSQTHVHEYLGSTKLAEENEERHNHRFAGVTSQVIPLPGWLHKHGLFTNTDFFEDHLQEIAVETGPDINVGDGKHVHFVEGTTTKDDGHVHEFIFATLIESPLTN